jgi:hypothetical protein
MQTAESRSYLDAWRILGPAVPGIVGGLLTALFSRRMRHPIALASMWASILGSVALVLVGLLIGFDILQQRPLCAIYPATGVIYGFALGVSARLMERGLLRLRRPPAC